MQTQIPLGNKSPTDIKFEEFDRLNPQVYDELVRMTREAKSARRQKIGIQMLFEVIRWNRLINTDDVYSKFKLNNNYGSRYARKIMAENPDLEGMFELRELKS